LWWWWWGWWSFEQFLVGMASTTTSADSVTVDIPPEQGKAANTSQPVGKSIKHAIHVANLIRPCGCTPIFHNPVSGYLMYAFSVIVRVVCLSFEATGGGTVEKGKKKDVKPAVIEAPAISFFEFYFRYADPWDYLAMFIGAAGGIVTGNHIARHEALYGVAVKSLPSSSS